MSDPGLAQLDEYLKIVDARVRTTRRASEVFFDMPPLDRAIEAERLIKRTLDEAYEGFVTDDETQPAQSDSAFDGIKAQYWEQARGVTEISGAKETDTLEDYLHVTQDRSQESIREMIREKFTPESPPSRLLDAVELYSMHLGMDIMTASRFATAHLKLQLPAMKRFAQSLVDQGILNEVDATTEVFREFSEVIVPRHIASIPHGRETASSFHGFLNSVPRIDEDESDLAPPLRMKAADARGMTAVYKLERRPYSAEELALAEQLIQDPLIQTTMLLFHMSIVDYSKKYLTGHPERMQHSLLPFSEFFVQSETGELIPNPKLIVVLNNNFLPALAGIVLRENIATEDITSAQFADAALEARKRRVFYAQIGKFNNHDEVTDTVDLEAFISRTCPAMQVLTNSLGTWTPKIYDHLKSIPDNSNTLF